MGEAAKNLHAEPEMKGWLCKWTNYIKGYQKRWFVLSNGLLSYYRTQAEMAHTCRGTISLHGAVIHTEDTCNLVISNGGTQTFHLRATSEVERQKWVTALELAKARAIRLMESEDEDDFATSQQQPDKNEIATVVKVLSAKLEDLNTCHELIIKHGAALQRSLGELEAVDSSSVPKISARVKAVNERATLFRITSNAMMNACNDFLVLVQSNGGKWQRMMQHERDQKLRLEEMVEQLARQHSHLEQAAQEATHGHSHKVASGSSVHSDDEFYDASENADTDFVVTFSTKGHRRSASDGSGHSEGAGVGVLDRGLSSSESEVDMETDGHEAQVVTATGKREKVYANNKRDGFEKNSNSSQRKRRIRIPERPNNSLNLWSIMKNCIGKDLTKIPMPVNFSEPLSLLQRLTEEFEYAELLDQAAECDNSLEEAVYVAIFTISPYATTSVRTGKPFNPLLGETYECDRRDDLGWRCISEQVSHHPPVSAMHCEGKGWICWQEFTMSSKFRGKYLQVIPLGIFHLEFKESGSHYTWRKITTTVHNIIVGKLWVDQHGEMDIINHTTGDNVHLKYAPYSYFSRDTPRKVTGVVTDKERQVHWVLSGTWDTKMEAAKVVNVQGEGKGKPILETSSPQVLWKRCWPASELDRMYNFTELAVQLNEWEDGVAPTDSRLRPDQRLMEEGKWEEANKEKVRLEEKQRAVRRQREHEAEQAAADGRPYSGYQPAWFEKQKDPITGNPVYMFNAKYWNSKESAEWNMCPDIY